jgi:site-specific DNA recombinase
VRPTAGRLDDVIDHIDAAVDRYLTAFETGAMEADICQPRLAELAERAKQLRARHAELAADLDHQPTAPSTAELREVREHIRHILTRGSAQERKSLYEALIDHIEITSDDTIVPIYRVPMTGNPNGPAPDRPKPTESGANNMVRALTSTVERRLRHKNTRAAATGPDLLLPVARERLVSRA